MVSTTWILPQKANYKLSLKDLGIAFAPASQYAPSQFVGNIIKVRNYVTEASLLLFASGKIVVVGAKSKWNSQFLSQFGRLIAESVYCTIDGARANLSGRTIFDKHVVQNAVGFSDFTFEIDLQQFRDAYPESVYFTGSFPAAQFYVWLTKDYECKCKSKLDKHVAMTLGKLAKSSCDCNIRCLLFKSGSIVLVGAKETHDIDSVFFRLKCIMPKFKLNAVTVVSPIVEQPLVITNVFQEMRKFKQKLCPVDGANTELPLVSFAYAGRLDETKMLLEMEPDQSVQAAFDVLCGMERTPKQEQVYNHLKQFLLLYFWQHSHHSPSNIATSRLTPSLVFN